MNTNPNKIHTNIDNAFSFGIGSSISPSSPPEGSEGVLPLPTHETLGADIETEKPSRAGQIGEGRYEARGGYATSIGSCLRTANVVKDAKATAPGYPHEAREMLAAGLEAAGHTEAPRN